MHHYASKDFPMHGAILDVAPCDVIVNHFVNDNILQFLL